jgi:lysozyme
MVNYTDVQIGQAERIALSIAEPFEGFRANPYPDPGTGAEPWAFGFGSTRDANELPVTCRTPPITYGEACNLAMRDMYRAFHTVALDITAPMTMHEIAAVMDFIYNVGAGNFKSSTLLRLINGQQYALAAEQFERWDQAGGAVLAGLLRRRLAEAQIFRTEDSHPG